MSGTSDGVEQHPDVEIVDATPKDAPDESDAILTEGSRPSALVLEEECAAFFDPAASSADVDNARGEADTIRKFS